jgi:hypothetical protein
MQTVISSANRKVSSRNSAYMQYAHIQQTQKTPAGWGLNSEHLIEELFHHMLNSIADFFFRTVAAGAVSRH